MQYWISDRQWVISGSLVTLQLTVDYVLFVETARLSVIVVVESMVVDEIISGLTSHSWLQHLVIQAAHFSYPEAFALAGRGGANSWHRTVLTSLPAERDSLCAETDQSN
jgi:hypothetical protein